jgi:hypothetical protein
MYWIDLAQGRDWWRDLEHSGFHKMPGTSRVAAELACSREGLGS